MGKRPAHPDLEPGKGGDGFLPGAVRSGSGICGKAGLPRNRQNGQSTLRSCRKRPRWGWRQMRFQVSQCPVRQAAGGIPCEVRKQDEAPGQRGHTDLCAKGRRKHALKVKSSPETAVLKAEKTAGSQNGNLRQKLSLCS